MGQRQPHPSNIATLLYAHTICIILFAVANPLTLPFAMFIRAVLCFCRSNAITSAVIGTTVRSAGQLDPKPPVLPQAM